MGGCEAAPGRPPPPRAPPHLGARARVLEEVHFAEVVGHGHHALVVGAAQRVDVRAIRAVWPHAWRHSGRSARPPPASARSPELPRAGAPGRRLRLRPPATFQAILPRERRGEERRGLRAGSAGGWTPPDTHTHTLDTPPPPPPWTPPSTPSPGRAPRPAPLLTVDVEAQHAGVGGPLPVPALVAIPQQLAAFAHVPWGEGAHQLSPHPARRGEAAGRPGWKG